MSNDVSTQRKDAHNIRPDGTVRRRMIVDVKTAWQLATVRFGYTGKLKAFNMLRKRIDIDLKF